MKTTLSIGLLLLATLGLHAHCQVPCGIYGDIAKFAELQQHAETVAKAMASMQAIEEKDDKDEDTLLDEQQFIRWTVNKESHAQKIQQEMLDYFLAQRIKPDQPKYEEKLILIHEIIVVAMKCKLTVDAKHAGTLAVKIKAFETLYFDK